MIHEKGTVARFSLASMQILNAKIYLVQNDQNYSTGDIISRIHNYVGIVDKGVELGKHDRIDYHLAMAFSWLMAFANRLHCSIEAEAWERFPGYCPYCTGLVCGCGSERPLTRVTTSPPKQPRPTSLKEFQAMLGRIYPRNNLKDSSRRLQQEVSELDQAYRLFKGTHEKRRLQKVMEEMVDVFARMCAVANCAPFDIADLMELHFKDGCPKCGRFPCDEGFSVAETVSVR